MKILNLFAGIGGNRINWKNHEIIAIEYEPKIASWYQFNFPQDKIIISDVYKFLNDINNHNLLKDIDFVWASPPCITHTMLPKNTHNKHIIHRKIPDMTGIYGLYIFLSNISSNFNKKLKFVIENIKPWYKPLIKPTVALERHYFWSNFHIPSKKFVKPYAHLNKSYADLTITEMLSFLPFSLPPFKISNKTQILHNCVNFEVAEYILNCIQAKRSLKNFI